MKLYDYKGAPNPRRVQIFLAEKGIDVPLEQVDITKGVNRQPPFLGKNPVGSVPVLELDDGTCIAESVSICRYFEALHPAPPLFGSTPLEVATVDMWLRRVELNVMSMVGMVWINDHPLTAALFAQNKPAANLSLLLDPLPRRSRTHPPGLLQQRVRPSGRVGDPDSDRCGIWSLVMGGLILHNDVTRWAAQARILC